MNFDAEMMAKNILRDHINASLCGVVYEPKDETEAYETCRQECAFILSEMLLKKEITFAQMYHVSEKLGPCCGKSSMSETFIESTRETL